MSNRVRLALIGSLLVTVAVYWVGLSGPLVFDDAQNLAPLNDWLQGRTGWLSVILDNRSGLFGRSLSMASFVLNVAIAGPSVWAFKAGNLLLHLLNGVAVFALFRALAGVGALTGRDRPVSAWWAWFAASVWLLHPLLASTVLYVVQRMAMLSALFTLLAMLAYVHGRIAVEAQQRRRSFLLLLVAVPVCTILAALSKENGVLAPALCAVIELFAFPPAPGKRRATPAKVFIGLALLAPAIVAIVLTLAQVLFITSGYANRPFTLTERLLTEARVLWDYVGAVIAPGGTRLGVYHDDYPLSRGLLDPPTTLIALVAWPAAAWIAWRLRRAIPAAGLGLGIFLVGQALESTVFPLLIYFEHRNYLPAVGVIWAITGLLAFATGKAKVRMHHPGGVFATAACVLVAVLAAGTAARAYAWSDMHRLLAQSLLAHPRSNMLKVDLILQAMSERPPALGLAKTYAEDLQRADDDNIRRLGTVEGVLIDCASGKSPDSQSVTDMFAGKPKRIDIVLMLAYESLSDGIAQTPCPGLTPLQMADGLSSMLDRAGLPSRQMEVWRLRFRTSNLYAASGDMDKAVEEAKLAYADGAAQPQVTLYVAKLLYQAGDVQGAARMADNLARQIRPDDTLAQQQLRQLRAELKAAN